MNCKNHRLLLSLSVWQKVITLSGFYFTFVFLRIVWTNWRCLWWQPKVFLCLSNPVLRQHVWSFRYNWIAIPSTFWTSGWRIFHSENQINLKLEYFFLIFIITVMKYIFIILSEIETFPIRVDDVSWKSKETGAVIQHESLKQNLYNYQENTFSDD